MPFAPKDIIFAIEEYRKAYMAYRDPHYYVSNRYKPLISSNQIVMGTGIIYEVMLYDTWVSVDKHHRFMMGKVLVDNTSFRSTSLQMSLEKLLNFVRTPFIDDLVFGKIQNCSG